MRAEKWFLIWGAVGACAISTSAARADSLSCHDRIVSTGDSTYQVRSVCGEPDATNRRVEMRTIRQNIAVPCLSGQGRCWTVLERSVEVTIDEWTYDFGRQRFIQYLTFEQGQLLHVESGSYGHKLAAMP